jgi:hypothetical protein
MISTISVNLGLLILKDLVYPIKILGLFRKTVAITTCGPGARHTSGNRQRRSVRVALISIFWEPSGKNTKGFSAKDDNQYKRWPERLNVPFQTSLNRGRSP